MAEQILLFSAFQLFVSVIAAMVAFVAWGYRDRPSGIPLVVMALGIAGWSIAHGLQPHIPDLATHILADSRHIFAAISSVGIFYVAVEYANLTRLKHRYLLVFLIALVVADALLLATNPIHGEFVIASEFTETGYLQEDFGTLFWLHVVVWFGLNFVTLGLFIRTFLRAKGIYRTQSGVLVAAGVVALFLVLFEQITETLPGLSFSIVGMTIFCATTLWAIFTADFLKTVPVARELLVDNMDDAVVALDERNRVVDINSRAAGLLGVDDNALGQPADEVLGAIPGLTEFIDTEGEQRSELEIAHGDQHRYLRLHISPVVPTGDNPPGNDQSLGKLFLMRDITDQKRREAELERREEELALLKDLQSRFLRHNLRNRLNIIRSNADFLVDHEDPTQEERYQAIVNASDQLLYWGTEARAIERLVEQDERRRIGIGDYVRRYVEFLDEEFPDIVFDVELDEPLEIVAVPQVERALENVIDNAARYNTAPDPTVSIRSERHGDRISIVVSDNGPGLNTHEIETIRDQGETDLQHGSGFGLWLVYWVVEKSEGDLTFEVNGGTTVTLTFDAVPADESLGSDADQP